MNNKKQSVLVALKTYNVGDKVTSYDLMHKARCRFLTINYMSKLMPILVDEGWVALVDHHKQKGRQYKLNLYEVVKNEL